MMKPVTPKHRLFALEYLKDLNATAAAKRAGYSKKTAYSIGQQLLKKLEIKTFIEAAQKKREDRLEITQEKWLRELARVYFADVTDYLQRDKKSSVVQIKPFEEFPEGASRAIESIEEKISLSEGRHLKVKLHSKLEAGRLIGQHLGYLKDQVKVPGLEDLAGSLYELSDRFLPTARGRKARKRSDESK